MQDETHIFSVGKTEGKAVILNFHGLGDPKGKMPHGEEEYWLSAQFFARILDALSGRRDVSISFDDCNESDYAIALPLLKARNMTARFFILAGRVGQNGFLSGKQLQSLYAEGMTIGNHGMHHRRWPDLNEQELQEELVEARDRIEQITAAPTVEAAYPFGAYNRRVLRGLRTAGYARVFTSDGGPARAESWLQPRNTLVRDDDLARVFSIIHEAPLGLSAVWRRFRLALKSWR